MPKKQPLYLKYNDLIAKIDMEGGRRWKKLLVMRDKQTGQIFLKLFRFGGSYRIYDSNQLLKVLDSLGVGAERAGWNIVGNPLLKQKLEEIESLKADKEKYKERINELYKQLLDIKREKLKEDIPKYERELQELKTLLETAQREQELQQWLKDHLWVLGAEYLDSQPIENVSQFAFDDSRFDFFLERYDTTFDIIEIKKSDVKLFSGDGETVDASRGTPISADVGKAVSQMIHYLELATYKRKELREEAKIDVYKPNGVVIIGRTEDSEAIKRLKSVSAHLKDIEVMSYDMLHKKAQLFVRHMKNRIA
jgi:vacuolar-type H+-ATPase subunit I/STV1